MNGYFICPKCGRTSYHPDDEVRGYCDACHEFTGAETMRYAPLPALSVEELVELSSAVAQRAEGFKSLRHLTKVDQVRRDVERRMSILTSLRAAIEEARLNAR